MSNAPSAPGISAKWISSSKFGIGKALDAAADVVSTIGYGILNEVYYSREDIPCIRDLGLLVANGKYFCPKNFSPKAKLQIIRRNYDFYHN